MITTKCCKSIVIKAYKTNPLDLNDSVQILICSNCRNECGTENVCDDCFGTKFEVVDEDDGEGHLMIGVGTRRCLSCV